MLHRACLSTTLYNYCLFNTKFYYSITYNQKKPIKTTLNRFNISTTLGSPVAAHFVLAVKDGYLWETYLVLVFKSQVETFCPLVIWSLRKHVNTKSGPQFHFKSNVLVYRSNTLMTSRRRLNKTMLTVLVPTHQVNSVSLICVSQLSGNKALPFRSVVCWELCHRHIFTNWVHNLASCTISCIQLNLKKPLLTGSVWCHNLDKKQISNPRWKGCHRLLSTASHIISIYMATSHKTNLSQLLQFLPEMSCCICSPLGPLSQLWTIEFAILVRWPM